VAPLDTRAKRIPPKVDAANRMVIIGLRPIVLRTGMLRLRLRVTISWLFMTKDHM
jgi:hypothetical protein